MTEKRFKQLNGEFAHSFIDTEDTSISYICDNENDCKNIVELLNAQHEENQQLKQENKELQFAYDECSNNKLFSRRKLETENKNLKDENRQLKNKLEFLNELNKPYGSIIEENKRLKAFIKRLTNDCGEIVLMNGIGYKVDKILEDLND